MKTKVISARIPKDIFNRIESFSVNKQMTISSVITELITSHFIGEITPEELSAFKKVLNMLTIQNIKNNPDDFYYMEIGKELVRNLSTNNDGSFKRNSDGMYYFKDTENLRDLVTEFLEHKNVN